MPSAMPATPSPRLDTLDALRGIALFGILVVNIQFFGSTLHGTAVADPVFDSAWDQAVSGFISLVFESKFYLLFSFLFGYSFTLQMAAAERDGAGIVPRMARRLLGLWGLGALHAVLLFPGDILTTYALLGVVLLAWRHAGDRQLVRRAIVLTGLTALVLGAIGGLASLVALPDDAAQSAAAAQQAAAAYTGTVATVVAQNVHELGQVWPVLLLIQAPCALAMFLLGMLAGRHGVLADPERFRALGTRLLWCGLLIGLPGAIAYAVAMTQFSRSPDGGLIGVAISLATAPFLSAAYAVLAIRLLRHPRGQGLRRWLAPAGRMALSGYLMQSAAMAVIFTAYGAGLVNRLSPGAVLGIALALFAVQLVISRWWMARFAYGGAEWALRAVTLWRWPAWRRPRRHGATPPG